MKKIQIHIFVLKYALNNSKLISKKILEISRFFSYFAIFGPKMRFLAVLGQGADADDLGFGFKLKKIMIGLNRKNQID